VTSGESTRAGSGGSRRARIAALAILALAALLIGGCAWGVTQDATGVGSSTATVKGLVADTEDGTSTYWFEYGPTKSYGSETTHRSITINDRDGHPVSEDLTGLDPETKYHYRLCAKSQQAVCGADYTFTTEAGASRLAITAAPGIYPDFDPTVPDYVTRCNNGPVDVTVDAPADTEVAVDGGPAKNGSFTTHVPLQSGQEFEFTTDTDVGTSRYHVRCLPNGFPNWTFEKFAPAEQKWYLVALGPYAIMFDGNGVPVWWVTGQPGDLKLLPDGTLAVGAGAPGNDKRYEILDLDGNVLNTVRTVGSELDAHDMQLLPNGNYMAMTYAPRSNPTDMTAYGGPANGIVLDAELQEVQPDGDVVWTWNSQGHISLDETGHWWQDFAIPQSVNNQYDVFHMNSMDVDGDSVVISLRHTDAIYKIDRDTGDVVWKLGGTPTPESLTVQGGPHPANPLGGQHYARYHDNGTLTAFDNGWEQNRAPRGVRFQIDEDAGTATFLEAKGDPDVPSAVCCGSARRSPSGSWVMAWGGGLTTPHPVSEFAPDGSRTFVYLFPGRFTYRVDAVPPGKLTRAELHAGMDAQYPR
jgi:hypothetical protein